MRGLLIAAAIFFIFVFAMVWLGIIAGLTFSMPLLTNFFPNQEMMTVIAMINVLFTIGIPILAIILGIVRVVFGRRMGRAWSIALVVFWFINLFSLVSIGGTLAQEFMVEEQTEEHLPTDAFAAETLELSYYEPADNNQGHVYVAGERVELPGAPVRFSIKKSSDAEWHLTKRVNARGRRGADARSLANELQLPLEMSTGSLASLREIPFSELSKWRDQEVKLEVQVPEGAFVSLDERVVGYGHIRVDQYPSGRNIYQMNSDGKLICQNCASTSEATPAEQKEAEYQDFNSILLRGPMKVTVEQGDNYDVRFSGHDQYLDEIVSFQEDGKLSVHLEAEDLDSPVRLFLTLPDLQALELEQTDDVRIKGFSGENLSISAAGDFELKTTVDVTELSIAARDGVKIEFTGSTQILNAHLEGASRLDTDRGRVKEARISAADGSRIKVKENVQILEQTISENSSLRIVN